MDKLVPRAPEQSSAPAAVAPRRRSRWRGYVIVALASAAIAALAVSSYYEQQTLGERIDTGIDSLSRSVQDGAQSVRRTVGGTLEEASSGLATASGDVSDAMTDAKITASVKAALAADPALSALQINVNTRQGIVQLEGPAPDAKARDRAEVLAAAPKGVVSVDNRLAVTNR